MMRVLEFFGCFTILDMEEVNKKPAPRGEIPQPPRSSGSDHNRSHIGPSCGTSCKRSKARI
ncbi:hypothetical protein DERP_011519 [Dermatophagoides pteronyssinus]|uniref:Uncharacterized protein n=1 Tax=Dermatophagoides pteronyssinus TaxID=6956 RepID=A0ABQ8JC35_DERPT|nr:hypothetical protein DERP_011519 [Dermatophagoides pteronyssinus]